MWLDKWLNFWLWVKTCLVFAIWHRNNHTKTKLCYNTGAVYNVSYKIKLHFWLKNLNLVIAKQWIILHFIIAFTVCWDKNNLWVQKDNTILKFQTYDPKKVKLNNQIILYQSRWMDLSVYKGFYPFLHEYSW